MRTLTTFSLSPVAVGVALALRGASTACPLSPSLRQSPHLRRLRRRQGQCGWPEGKAPCEPALKRLVFEPLRAMSTTGNALLDPSKLALGPRRSRLRVTAPRKVLWSPSRCGLTVGASRRRRASHMELRAMQRDRLGWTA